MARWKSKSLAAPEIWIGLGSNLGDRAAHLNFGLERLARLGRIVAVSSIYETSPWDDAEQPWYLNAVCGIVTEADNPLVLLAALKAIEAEAQRIPGDRWAPRTLDLDILLWGSRIIREQNLIVPHPAIASRRFVLTPLAEVAPTLIHPESGMTISWLLELCKDEGSVRLWGKVVDL